MNDSLAELFKRAGVTEDDPLQLLKVLQQQGVVPSVKWNPELPMQYMGAYVPSKNMMEFDPNVPPNRGTAVHETQHALDEAIRRSAPMFGSSQLNDAYQKLNQPPALRTYYREEDRASPEERRAYGLSNMLYPKEAKRPDRAHMDATMASEAAILRELFSRKSK